MAPDEGSLRGVTPEDVYGALGLKQDLRVLAQGQPHVLASIGNSVVIGERDTTGGWGSRAFRRAPYVKSHTATAEIHFPEDRTSLDSYLVGAHALLGRRMEGDLYMLSISPDAPRKHVDRGGVRVATEIKYGLKALFGTNDGAGYVTGKVGFSNSDGLRVNQLDGDVDFERGLRAYFGDFQRNTVDFDAGDFASRFEGTDIGVEHLAMEDGSPLDLVELMFMPVYLELREGGRNFGLGVLQHMSALKGPIDKADLTGKLQTLMPDGNVAVRMTPVSGLQEGYKGSTFYLG